MDSRVSRVALGGDAAHLENQRLKIFRAGVLAGGGSGFARNIFFHQRAAVIVGAGVQAELRELAVQLHPRNLNVIDRTREQQASQRVDLEMFGESWPGARQSLMVEQRVLMDEAERNELGEAAGFGLDLAQQAHLADPVRGGFRVSIHECRSGANAAAVRGADDLDPLRGRKFVGGEDVANLVVENFGGGAGQRAQAVVAQHRKIVGQRHAGEFDAVDNFHGRERVDVHAGHGVFYGAKNVAIMKLGKIARQAALNADFRGAELPGFDRFSRHLSSVRK